MLLERRRAFLGGHDVCRIFGKPLFQYLNRKRFTGFKFKPPLSIPCVWEQARAPILARNGPLLAIIIKIIAVDWNAVCVYAEEGSGTSWANLGFYKEIF